MTSRRGTTRRDETRKTYSSKLESNSKQRLGLFGTNAFLVNEVSNLFYLLQAASQRSVVGVTCWCSLEDLL